MISGVSLKRRNEARALWEHHNPGITTVRARLSPRLSGAMSNGTPARARETKRGTENDLLRRLLHRLALVDDYPLELTEALYEKRHDPVRGLERAAPQRRCDLVAPDRGRPRPR